MSLKTQSFRVVMAVSSVDACGRRAGWMSEAWLCRLLPQGGPCWPLPAPARCLPPVAWPCRSLLSGLCVLNPSWPHCTPLTSP